MIEYKFIADVNNILFIGTTLFRMLSLRSSTFNLKWLRNEIFWSFTRLTVFNWLVSLNTRTHDFHTFSISDCPHFQLVPFVRSIKKGNLIKLDFNFERMKITYLINFFCILFTQSDKDPCPACSPNNRVKTTYPKMFHYQPLLSSIHMSVLYHLINCFCRYNKDW